MKENTQICNIEIYNKPIGNKLWASDAISKLKNTFQCFNWYVAYHNAHDCEARHYHLILEFPNSRPRVSQLMKCLSLDIQFFERIKSLPKAVQYLSHKNDISKEQNIKVFTNNKARYDELYNLETTLNARKAEKIELSDEIIMDYYNDLIDIEEIKGNFTLQTLVKHSKFFDDLEASKIKYKSKLKVRSQTFYIGGESGSGKTTIAKYIAKINGLSVYIANQRNGLDSYCGEDCIIFDDYRSDIPYSEFIKIIDPYNINIASCRYNNKKIIAKLFIITNTLPLEKALYQGINEKEDGSINQLYRRIDKYIWVSDYGDFLNVEVNEHSKNKFEFHFSAESSRVYSKLDLYEEAETFEIKI